jgi:hypothetical protein
MLIAGLIVVAMWIAWSIFSSIAMALLQGALGINAAGNNIFAPAFQRAGPMFGDATGLMLFIATQILGALINTAAYAWLQTGLLRYSLSAARGRQPDLSLLFSSANYVLRMIGFSMLYTLIMYLIMGVGAIPGVIAQEPIVLIIGMLVALLIVAVVMLMFTLVPLFIVDRNEGVFQAMGNSWSYMSGNFLTVFGLFIVLGFLCALIAVFTCGIGYIGVIPYMCLLQTVMYLMATGQMARR